MIIQREAFLYPAQAQRLVLCNLSDAEKARKGKKIIMEIHAQLLAGVPVTAAYF